MARRPTTVPKETYYEIEVMEAYMHTHTRAHTLLVQIHKTHTCMEMCNKHTHARTHALAATLFNN